MLLIEIIKVAMSYKQLFFLNSTYFPFSKPPLVSLTIHISVYEKPPCDFEQIVRYM